MKTLCLLGSPRRGGNSDSLAECFLKQAVARGAEIEVVVLAELSYNGCINLYECKTGASHCGQRDDLTPVLQAIAESQVLVIASPVYFTNITGQLKLAIDRMFSFLVPDYPNVSPPSRLMGERHVVLVQTQGEGEDRYENLLVDYAPAFNGLGFTRHHLIRAWGVRGSNEVKTNPGFVKQAESVATVVYPGT